MRKTTKKTLLTLAVMLPLLPGAKAVGTLPKETVGVFDLRVENLRTPNNIDRLVPRFSWKLDGDGRGIWQEVYRIQVEDADAGQRLWDSGEVKSDQQLLIEYAGEPLRSNGAYRWRVGVRSAGEAVWSKWAEFQTAYLAGDDWTAQWIRPDFSALEGADGFKRYERELPESKIPAVEWVSDEPYIQRWIDAATMQSHRLPKEKQAAFQHDRMNEIRPAPMFRKTVVVKQGLKRAVLHGCGLGLAEWSVNGESLGECTFDPAIADYDKRAFYQTFDVTDLLKPGQNKLGALLGEGWYGESLAYAELHSLPGYGEPGLIAQLELIYADGTRERVVSDASWEATWEGPVVKNGIWCGSVYDARKGNPAGWHSARVAKPLSPKLEAQQVECINVVEKTPAKSVAKPKPGVWVFDLGRIICGVVELDLPDLPVGRELLLTYGQSLDRDGTVWGTGKMSVTSNNADLYICKGGGGETFIPKFTFNAFRYIQIEGLEEKPEPGMLTGLFTSTDMPVASTFACSEPLFNDMHNAFVRTTQANTRHMFTDTPTRERTGWFTWPNARAIIANFDSHAYWEKFLGDCRTSATESTVGSHIMGWRADEERVQFDSRREFQTLERVGPGMAPWTRRSDLPEQRLSNVFYPLEMFIRTGDRSLIVDHYETAKSVVDAIALIRMDGLAVSMVGDWHDAVKPDLDIAYRRERGLERDDVFGGVIGGGYPVHTPGRVCGTVHLYLGALALAETAEELGKANDVVTYRALAEELKAAFNRHYFDPESGRYSYTTPKGNTYESQTMYGYALYHHLVPEEKRELTMQRFLEHIAEYGGHPTSGQLGMDRVVKALTTGGHAQAAYDLLTVKGFPGFDYMLSFGSQTTWETWGEAILNATPKGSKTIIRGRRPQEHCQWVAVDTWFHEYVLGIQPDPEAPGFKHFTIKPYMWNQLDWAKGTCETPRGSIVSDWKNENGTFRWNVTVPPNSTATVYIPAAAADAVTESGQPLAEAEGVVFQTMENGRVVCKLQSGSYTFEAGE